MANRRTTDCSLVPGIAAHAPRELLQRLHGQAFRRNLLEHLLHALRFFPRHQRFAELLQVHGRAVIAGDGPNLVAGQDVHDQFALLQAADQLRQQMGAGGAIPFFAERGIEETPGVFRFIQVIVDLCLIILVHEIHLLLGAIELRRQFFQPRVMHPEPRFDLADGGAHLRGIRGAEKLVQQAVAAFKLLPQPFTLLFQSRNFRAAMLGFRK